MELKQTSGSGKWKHLQQTEYTLRDHTFFERNQNREMRKMKMQRRQHSRQRDTLTLTSEHRVACGIAGSYKLKWMLVKLYTTSSVVVSIEIWEHIVSEQSQAKKEVEDLCWREEKEIEETKKRIINFSIFSIGLFISFGIFLFLSLSLSAILFSFSVHFSGSWTCNWWIYSLNYRSHNSNRRHRCRQFLMFHVMSSFCFD